MQYFYLPTAWKLTQSSQSVFAPLNEINKGEGDIDFTLEKLASICSNNGRDEDDDNTQVECKTEAPYASKGDEQQITVADGVPG